jgi:hypothetical protein
MKFKFIKETKTYLLTKGDDDLHVLVPSEHEGFPVTEIGEEAFLGCTKLESIDIPSSIKVIGQRAFYRVKSLKKINFVEGLEKIEKEAFLTTSLKSILLPDTLMFIGQSAFHNNESLTEVKLPKHLTELSLHVFSYCKSFTSINLPETLKYIRPNAFSSCEKIKSISIPAGVKIIEEGAFSFCESLKQVIFHEGLEEIHQGAFKLYGDLKEVKLPNSLRIIGEEAFLSAGLVYISIPPAVKKIHKQAFSKNSLKEIHLSEGLEQIGVKAFEFNKLLKGINLPKSLKQIDHFAFLWCSSLKKVEVLNESITLGKGVFSHTGYQLMKENKNLTMKEATKKVTNKMTRKKVVKTKANQSNIEIEDDLDNDIPVLEDPKHLKVIQDFVNNEIQFSPTLNDIAEKYTSFINEVNGERYSFTMISDHVAVNLKETVEKNLLMSKVVTILSDTFERTDYLLPF